MQVRSEKNYSENHYIDPIKILSRARPELVEGYLRARSRKIFYPQSHSSIGVPIERMQMGRADEREEYKRIGLAK